MRLTEDEQFAAPSDERELEAIDRALAGQRVDPELEELAMLAAELRGERPQPSAEAEETLESGGRALAASAIASDAPHACGAVGGAGDAPGRGRGGDLRQRGVRRGAERRPAAERAEPGRAGREGRRTSSPDALGRGAQVRADGAREAARGSAGSLAGAANRRLAKDVNLELSTAPDDFRDAADGLDVVRDHRGYVLISHVSGGDPGVDGAERGHASFELRIPSGELSAAIGDLSDLGHVVSRSDGTLDITKRFVSARKRIDGLTAARGRLLRELGEAATVGERRSIRARLRIVERRLAAAHHDLAKAQQRVHLVPVSVAITADERAASGGSWTIGDAFHDAGRVPVIAGGRGAGGRGGAAAGGTAWGPRRRRLARLGPPSARPGARRLHRLTARGYSS